MSKRILICFIMIFPGVVFAFDGTFSIDAFYNPIMSQNAAWSSLNYVNSYNNIGNPVRSYIDDGGSTNRGSPTTGGSKSTKVPARKQATATIKKMTARFPANFRPQLKQAFKQLYIFYPQIEDGLGIPRRDLAGTTAFYIAMNYIAYRNVDVTNNEFLKVVSQVRDGFGKSRRITKMKPEKKRELYEVFAIVGALVAGGIDVYQKQPTPDPTMQQNLQNLGRTNLENLFNISADQIFITSEGLVFVQ